MRVLHIVSHVGTYGGERFVPALAAAQRRAGLDAHVATLYDGPASRATMEVPLHSAGRTYAGRAKGGGFLFFFRLLRLIRQLRPDVVHTHLAHAKHWGRLAAMIAKVPTIVHTEHANAFREPPLKKTLARILHRRTAAVVAFSHAHAQRVAAHDGVAPDRIAVIPNGIEVNARALDRNAARARLHVAAGQHVVLSAGRLDSVKRHDLAIDALALLSRGLDAQLFIAGDGPLRDALLARARERRVEARLHLLGYRADVGALMAAADVALNSSESEAMPLALLEAMCAGVPIACAPWPGAAELFAEVGQIASDASAAALAAAIVSALRPEALLRARAAMPLARETFSIDATAARYAALYRSLTPDGGRSPSANRSEVPARYPWQRLV